jgi:L-ribulose-5-phosphate 4-epimerase
MLEKLKKIVYDANLNLVSNGLVIHTWGNVSGRDFKSGLIVIKPSGVSYESMKQDDMVVIDPEGNVFETVVGTVKPASPPFRKTCASARGGPFAAPFRTQPFLSYLRFLAGHI